ncbi:alpha/beta fold hydrolase [Rhodococcus opacus]|uniref:alpha/beta fold hydrolase n=1 Tax=Rhodococcus opacus TaxID=37919 RepID=UPI001C4962BD|nr:alpha/beta hydrolase [Rhodococcus opacus]MBV6754903.1 alpha/beta hydrolase [Rhodococcus opacus]
MTTELRTLTVRTPELTLRALAWGPEDGPLALLLHGFPDSATTWRHLGPLLAAQGWRVVAPYNRGYAPSDVPADGSYQLGALIGDVADIHDALGADGRAVLIGHDWGAAIASGVSHHAPQRFSSVVLLAVPPMPAVVSLFRTPRPRNLPLVLRQLPRSWYMSVAQVPVLSQLLGERLIRLLWALWAPGYDYRPDLDAVLNSLPDRTRRRAALSYYRALWNPLYRRRKYAEEQRAAFGRARVRTLYLHGAADTCGLIDLGSHALSFLPAGSRACVVPGTGHFLHLEDPDTVNRYVLEFVGPAPTAPLTSPRRIHGTHPS